MPSTTVEITADGETWTHSAYALGFDDREGQARRRSRTSSSDALDLLERRRAAEPYQPEAIRLSATETTGVGLRGRAGGLAGGVDLATVGACTVVDDPAAVAAVADALAGADQTQVFAAGRPHLVGRRGRRAAGGRPALRRLVVDPRSLESIARGGRPVARGGESAWPSSRSGSSATRCCARRAREVVDFDKELRTLVADLTDTMLEAPGAGLAAPQIGVGLRVFTWHVDGEVGHLVNPDLTLSEEIQDGPEGCLSHPRPHLRLPPRACGRGPRLRHARRAGHRRGLASCSPARSSTRPTTSTASCSSTGSTPRPARLAMKEIRESDWFGLERPDRQGQPPRHPRARALVRRGLRRHPRGRAPVARRRRRVRRTSWSASSPGPTPPPGRGRTLVASPVAQRAEELGVPVLKPGHPREPEFQDGAARAGARLLPGRRLRRAAAAVRARHPAARLGQPALLVPARLARRGPGAARDLGRRRGHRRHHVPHRARRWTPARRSA